MWYTTAAFAAVLVLSLGPVSIFLALLRPGWLRAVKRRPNLFRAYLALAWWPCCRFRRWCLRGSIAQAQARCLYVHAGRRDKEPAEMPQSELPAQPEATARLVCVSDTHATASLLALPPGDVLLHAGDILLADRGGVAELQAFRAWLRKQRCAQKLVVGGNHDGTLERLGREEAQKLLNGAGCRYLLDEAVNLEIQGKSLRVYGSPYSLRENKASDNTAFQGPCPTLPAGVDVLLTHGPPKEGPRTPGCEDLQGAVLAVRPRVHVCGHLHWRYGAKWLGSTLHVNASVCDGAYAPLHPPVVIDLPLREPRGPQSSVLY